MRGWGWGESGGGREREREREPRGSRELPRRTCLGREEASASGRSLLGTRRSRCGLGLHPERGKTHERPHRTRPASSRLLIVGAEGLAAGGRWGAAGEGPLAAAGSPQGTGARRCFAPRASSSRGMESPAKVPDTSSLTSMTLSPRAGACSRCQIVTCASSPFDVLCVSSMVDPALF